LGEKRRRVGFARCPNRKHRRVVTRRNASKLDRTLCRASSKRRQQIAERVAALIRMTAAVHVDKLTELVDVPDGMLQR
jgi:hypothetical protein